MVWKLTLGLWLWDYESNMAAAVSGPANCSTVKQQNRR